MAPRQNPSTSMASSYAPLQALQDDDKLSFNLHRLIFDLLNFKDRKESRHNLEQVVDQVYIGYPYFNDAEAKRLKKFKPREAKSMSVEQLIQNTIAEKLSKPGGHRAAQYQICTAHDLAPVFLRAFEIDPKDLRDKAFVKRMKEEELGEADVQTRTKK